MLQFLRMRNDVASVRRNEHQSTASALLLFTTTVHYFLFIGYFLFLQGKLLEASVAKAFYSRFGSRLLGTADGDGERVLCNIRCCLLF
jgi:hypothetical protein